MRVLLLRLLQVVVQTLTLLFSMLLVLHFLAYLEEMIHRYFNRKKLYYSKPPQNFRISGVAKLTKLLGIYEIVNVPSVFF